MQIADLSLALSNCGWPHVALLLFFFLSSAVAGTILQRDVYLRAEKPNGDVTGGNSYRPSSTLANQRRKYSVPLMTLEHLVRAFIQPKPVSTHAQHTNIG